MDKTCILLVDDHEVVRKGFKALINMEAHLLVTAEAASVSQAKRLLTEQTFDLLITDLSLPDSSGLDILTHISSHALSLKTIVFSMYDREPYISQALSLGANGYLSKRTASDDIVKAIEKVIAGEDFLSADVIVNLTKNLNSKTQSDIHSLTAREREVFILLAKGMLVKEVAKQLDIMPKTAHSHRRNIFEKLSCSNSFELTKIALKQHLIVEQDLI